MGISIRWALGLALLLVGVAARGQDRFDDRYYYPPAGGAPPVGASDLPALAREAARESRRFLDDAYAELGGGYIGQPVIVRGQAMVQAAEALRAQVDRNGSAIPSYAARFDAAVAGVRSAMDAVGGASYAPAAARGLRRVERLARDLRGLAGGGGYYPEPPVPPGSRINRPLFRSAAAATAGDAGQAAASLYESGWAGSYPYDQVAQRLDAMSGSLQSLTYLVDRSSTDEQIQDGLRPAQGLANQINELLGRSPGRLPPFKAWWDRVQHGINRLAILSRGGADLGPGPRPPVVDPPVRPPIYPPVYPPVRPPITPPILPPGPNPGAGVAIGLIDQMGAELEQFVASVRANVNSVPEGFQFIRDAQGLLSNLSRIRRGLMAGADRSSLQRPLAEADNQRRQLRDRTARLADGRTSGPNIDRVRRVNALFNQLLTAMPG